MSNSTKKEEVKSKLNKEIVNGDKGIDSLKESSRPLTKVKSSKSSALTNKNLTKK